MGIRTSLAAALSPSHTDARFSEDPPLAAPGVAVASPSPPPGAGTSAAIADAKAHRLAMHTALAVPAVRKAVHIIAGTIGTFRLGVWDGPTRLADTDPRTAWLSQPEPSRTLQHTITHTVTDLIWYDRAVWKVADRTTLGAVRAVERIHPDRISVVPDTHDPHTVGQWIIDGRAVPDQSLIIFDACGLGGLRRHGHHLLDLYERLQTAAGRYADAPHPAAILRNAGHPLTPDEITALLDQWEQARGTRHVGYMNDVMSYETVDGYSARDLQLIEAREHAAIEVARLFGLPAFALDAAQPGSSLTYGNVVDRRRDLIEALRPWMAVIENTLSLDDRRGKQPRGIALPHGLVARFDADAYTRDAPGERMATWAQALAAGVLTVPEVRAREPLARTA